MKIKLVSIFIFTIGTFCASAQNDRQWATYYGGSAKDYAMDVTTDNSGNVYLTGYAGSTSGIASGGFQNSFGGGLWDAFLLKLDSDGNMIWATYYGGTGADIARSVATDSDGNVYIGGETQSTSGIASGGFQNTHGGGNNDAFLAKFDASGNRIWGTYFGGAGEEDYCWGLAIDGNGDVYLSGQTRSTTNIASGGFQNTYGGGIKPDAFLVKFDSSGNRLWSTYYGGAEEDKGRGVSIDNSNNVYLAGVTKSDSGIAFGGFQDVLAGTFDAFLVKFDTDGNRIWATYYGGPSNEETRGVATDASGNVYMAGFTLSSSGIASGGFQDTLAGGFDGFLVKFNEAGSRLWATYYGGPDDDFSHAVTTDNNGVYIAMYTSSTSNLTSGGFQDSAGGFYDAVLVKFGPVGGRHCATYYGGSGLDVGQAVTTDGLGNVYLAGATDSPDNIGSGGIQNTYGGGVNDAFLVKFTECILLSTQDLESPNNWSIYPNPITQKSVLKFQNSGNQDCRLEIFNTQGRSLRTLTSIKGDQVKIEKQNLRSGLYFFRLNDLQGNRLACGKFAIE